MDDNSVEKQLSVHLKWKLYTEVNLQVIKPRFSARLAQKYTIFEFKAQGQFQAAFSVHLYHSKDVKCFFLHSIDLPYKGTNCNSSLLQSQQLHSPKSFRRPPISRQGTGNGSKEPQLHPKANTAGNCAAHHRIQSSIVWFMPTRGCFSWCGILTDITSSPEAPTGCTEPFITLPGINILPVSAFKCQSWLIFFFADWRKDTYSVGRCHSLDDSQFWVRSRPALLWLYGKWTRWVSCLHSGNPPGYCFPFVWYHTTGFFWAGCSCKQRTRQPTFPS